MAWVAELVVESFWLCYNLQRDGEKSQNNHGKHDIAIPSKTGKNHNHTLVHMEGMEISDD